MLNLYMLKPPPPGLEDLNSGEDTDDEENPRKQIPVWAEGALLRTSLLKQTYMCPDLDQIFAVTDAPDLENIFAVKKKRFQKRTSSATWDAAPASFMHKRLA